MPALTLTRVAHSTVLLDFDGHTILTDPWYSEKPGYYHGEPYGIGLADLPQLAGVIGSHGHYDHFDMRSFAAYPDKTVPFGVASGMAGAARAVGFQHVTELEPWHTTTLGGVRVTAVPGKHSVPEICFVLEADGYTVFFGGDSLLVPEFQEVARRFPRIDLALLPINGLMIRPLGNRKVVMNAVDAASLCAILRPRVAVPIHYRFTAGRLRDRLLLKYDGTPEIFVRETHARAPAATVRVLAPGEPLALALSAM